MIHTLAPVEPPFEDNVAQVLQAYPQRGGVLLSLFRVFANSLRFLMKGMPNLLDAGSPFTLRERELIILRVTARRDCPYEWGVHVAAFARHAGLSEAEVAATWTGPSDDPVWADTDRALLRTVDALCDRGGLDDQERAGVQALLTVEQQLELCALVGAYTTVACVASLARLGPEPFAPAPPTRTA